MLLPSIRSAVAALPALLVFVAAQAAAADCDLAIRYTTFVAEQGRRAFESQNFVEGGNIGASARIPAIDAAQQARACGCTEAVAPLNEAQLAAARANNVFNIDGAQAYGARIRKEADAALEALRRCSAR
jgi:hypothetical protein